MSFLTDMEARLVADAKAVEEKIVEVATELGTAVVQDLEAFVSQFSGIAINAVIAEAPKLISGQEKFGAAVTSVFQQAEAAGLNVAVQDAQMLVQSAFRQVQAVASTAAQP
jgi:hypothetical protein